MWLKKKLSCSTESDQYFFGMGDRRCSASVRSPLQCLQFPMIQCGQDGHQIRVSWTDSTFIQEYSVHNLVHKRDIWKHVEGQAGNSFKPNSDMEEPRIDLNENSDLNVQVQFSSCS